VLAIHHHGFRGVPKTGHVSRQVADSLSIRIAQGPGKLGRKAMIIFLHFALCVERRFPTGLQRAGHQTIRRFHGLILSLRPLGVLSGTLPLLLPLIVQATAFLVSIGCGFEGQFQCRRF
jgi:hypothetical protein